MTEETTVSDVEETDKPFNERCIREQLANLRKQGVPGRALFSKGSQDEPFILPLAHGLGVIGLMLEYEVLTEDEKRRLASRINVLLRAHPPMKINVQVEKGVADA